MPITQGMVKYVAVCLGNRISRISSMNEPETKPLKLWCQTLKQVVDQHGWCACVKFCSVQ